MKIVDREAAFECATYLYDWDKEIDILLDEMDDKDLGDDPELLSEKQLLDLDAIAASAIAGLTHQNDDALGVCIQYILETEQADALQQLAEHDISFKKMSVETLHLANKVLESHVFHQACKAIGVDTIETLKAA